MEFIESYINWFKNNSKERLLSTGWTEIMLPFMDLNNDFICLYIKKDNDKVTIVDDNYVNTVLTLNRIKFSDKMKNLLTRYNITTIEEWGLMLETTEENYLESLNNFISVIIILTSGIGDE